MRTLILILLLLPVLATAKQYKYGSINIIQKGDDYFSLDKAKLIKSGGQISINGNYLTIDHKRYELSEYKNNGLYKAKKCFFKLVYESGNLVCVQQLKFGRVYIYNIIDEDAIIGSSSNSLFNYKYTDL